MTTEWFTVKNIETIDSPALLFYPERIAENIRRTVAMAGGTGQLRPHIKTHKCAEVLRMQMAAGISKFKCATIAEAEMAALADAADVLLAYQPSGPRARRFVRLVEQFALKSKFACIVDNDATMRELAGLATAATGRLRVLVDIDCGQGRTGIPAGLRAFELYKQICAQPKLEACGLHAYDGHIHDSDFAARKRNCDEAFMPVEALRNDLIAAGMNVPAIVAGGTPTFPIHAAREKRAHLEFSPGTNILWDAGYAKAFPDLDFLIPAVVLARVASKPGETRLCLDVGHKAVASEGPQPRIVFPELINSQVLMHNEEHLVVEAENGRDFKVGDALYGLPKHICPTVALYNEATVVRDGLAGERWKIAGRDRRLSI